MSVIVMALKKFIAEEVVANNPDLILAPDHGIYRRHCIFNARYFAEICRAQLTFVRRLAVYEYSSMAFLCLSIFIVDIHHGCCYILRINLYDIYKTFHALLNKILNVTKLKLRQRL